MKSNLNLALMETNYQLLRQNPVSSPTYALLSLVQGLIVISIPIQLQLSHYSEQYFQMIYNHKFPTTILAVLSIMLTYQFLVLTVYTLLVLATYLNVRKTYWEQAEFSNYKVHKVLISMFIANETVLQLPNKALAIIVIVHKFVLRDHSEAHIVFLAFFVLILQITMSVIFNYFLPCIFPMPSVPWAISESKGFLINELVQYLLAASFSIPHTSGALPYILGVATFLTLVVSGIVVTYYQSKQTTVTIFNQMAFLGSLIILTLKSFNKTEQEAKYIFIQLLLILVLFGMKFAYSRLKIQNAISSRKVTSIHQLPFFLWSLSQAFQEVVFEESSFRLKSLEWKRKNKDRFIFIQGLIIRHYQRCNFEACPCHEQSSLELMNALFYQSQSKITQKVVKEALFLLIEINFQTMRAYLKDQNERIDMNSNLFLIRSFFYLHCTDFLVNCLHEANQQHDCKTSKFQECFQNYVLKKIILEQHQERIQKKQDASTQKSFYQYLVYERSFREIIRVMDAMSEQQREHWVSVIKGEFDIRAAYQLGQTFLKHYLKLLDIKERIRQHCGDILFIEQVTWRFHKDILNFEIEAEEMVEKVRGIIIQSKVVEKNHHKKLGQVFDQDSSIITISANPGSFQQIKLFSKSLEDLTGFSEETLLKSKLPLLLPSLYDEVHHRFLQKFLRKPTEYQATYKNMRNLWIKTKTNTIKSVNLSLSFIINEEQEIDFVGLIKLKKQKEIFGETYPDSFVYSIMTDVSNKILHYSHNFAEQFQCSQVIMQKDVFISSIIPNLPEDFDDINSQSTYYLNMQELQESIEIIDRKMATFGFFIKLAFQRVHLEEKTGLFFDFIIINEDSSSCMQRQNPFFQDFSSFQPLLLSRTGKLQDMKSSEYQNDPPSPQKSSEKALDMLQFASCSSSDSHSQSSEQKQYAEMNEVKNFNSLTSCSNYLRRLRLFFFFGYILTIALAGAFLGICMKIKHEYVENLEALEMEKLVKMAFSNAELLTLSTIIFSNLPEEFQEEQLVSLEPSVSEAFLSSLSTGSSLLQYTIGNFSLQQQNWNEDLSSIVKEEPIQLLSITDKGHLMEYDLSFSNAINLMLQNVQILSQTDHEDFQLRWDFIEESQTEVYQEQIEKAQGSYQELLQNIFFLFYNGSRKIHDQLFTIDNYYLDFILAKHSLYNKWIYIFVIGSVVLLMLMSGAYIPILIALQNQLRITMQISLSISKEELAQMLENIKGFDHFLTSQSYSRSEKNERKKKTEERRQTQLSKPQETLGQSQMNSTQQPFQQNKEVWLEVLNFDQKKKKEDIKIKKKNSLNKSREDSFVAEEQKEQDQEEEEPHENEVSFPTTQKTVTKGASETVRSVKYQYQIRNGKTYYVLVALTFGICLCCYFGVVYLVQNNIIDQFQDGFKEMDVFYLTTPCNYLLTFLYLNAVMFNQSFGSNSSAGSRYQTLSDKCDENEEKYREITLNSEGMFYEIYNILIELDSSGHCNFTLSEGYSTFDQCESVLDGLLNLGLTQAQKVIRTQLTQKVVHYQMLLPGERTEETLRERFFDLEVLNNAIVVFFHIGQVLQALEPQVVAKFEEEIVQRDQIITVIFVIFVILVTLVQVVIQVFSMGKINAKLKTIKVLLKIIPWKILMKQKRRFSLLNVKDLYSQF